jgi:hypothetical protein
MPGSGPYCATSRRPRMTAITERWTGGCRHELLHRTLTWNQAHLRHILHDYETHHNQHRPHRSPPPKPLPPTCRSCAVPRPKTGTRRWPDQRISPDRMTTDEVFGTHRRLLRAGRQRLTPSFTFALPGNQDCPSDGPGRTGQSVRRRAHCRRSCSTARIRRSLEPVHENPL